MIVESVLSALQRCGLGRKALWNITKENKLEKRTIELIAPRPDGSGYEIYHRATPKPVTPNRAPRPDWLRVRLPSGENYFELKKLMRERGLHTVCEEANCPNIAECWSHRTATFLML